MPNSAKPFRSHALVGSFLLLLGALIIGFGWVVPSRFKSVPFQVVREAGQSGASVSDKGRALLLDGNFGAARLMAEAARELEEAKASLLLSQVSRELEANPQLARWGAWDPFLDAALKDVPLDAYSSEPGALGILLGKPCRAAVSGLLENSRNPLVQDLLATGEFTTYRRLFPVSSTSGRPLEVTLLGLGLLAQGDHFSDTLRGELRGLILDAKATGSIGTLEDFYLDTLSLMRVFDWGQLKEVFAKLESADHLKRMRFLLHRKSEQQPLVFAMGLNARDASDLFSYLEAFGDLGFERLESALATGIDGYLLALREQLPIEDEALEDSGSLVSKLQVAMSPFSLKNPRLSLAIKYSSFFVGSFLALWGVSMFGRFYRETISPVLAFTQRFFGATASVLIFAVLSEPYLSASGAFDGYDFSFVMPVLTQVDGEIQIVETTSTTSMQPATLLTIAFFFLLQALVFLICMLKVREIEKRELDPLVKLKLMENEENLFDSGLYVGIAGTCIALVMQVINLVDHNLLAAYSSNLFGILCVAIVKIRLVRPYKTKLIMAGERQIVSLSEKS
ncbi:hypothetical protein IEN85_04235 [Pelagicoccus sp. NFK12]|uniref:Uncharacterized protein n=1 Tax=Pelagicoccus enzymogenes TaxID=2773457 RepID=A0A927F5R6_9BACT|nr:hypothetical protein [Pelagicoccus enzymogenes]MBD5778687.1 hypothetical protein [Pelagicoccus enzymogenes]